jgi:GntR family transcriptional regulator
MNDCLEPELIVQGGAPIHCQLRDQLRDYILQGILLPGEELPTVRAAAVGLAVSPHVVRRAYADLECAGLVTNHDGATFVTSPPLPLPPVLAELCEEFLGRAAEHGFPAEEVLRAIQTLAHQRGLP